MFSIERFQSYLSTENFGKDIVFYEKTGSTNDEAKKMAREGKKEGLLVLSDRQTAGKGRLGRKWFSPEKTGIYCSLILRPLIPVSNISILTILSGASLIETIKNETSLVPLLKWPNDVLINGKKVSGILTESQSNRSRVEFAILGIGVNINNIREEFPDNLPSSSTSLKIETNKDVNREKFLSSLMFHLEKNYNSFREKNSKIILNIWRENNNTLGKKVTVHQGNRLITGLAKDIDDEGNLLVRINNGNTEKVFSGDVRC